MKMIKIYEINVPKCLRNR